jgi:hypothetical protein
MSSCLRTFQRYELQFADDAQRRFVCRQIHVCVSRVCSSPHTVAGAGDGVLKDNTSIRLNAAEAPLQCTMAIRPSSLFLLHCLVSTLSSLLLSFDPIFLHCLVSTA